MAKQSSPLAQRIDALVKQRGEHVAALASIDSKLQQIQKLLGVAVEAAADAAADASDAPKAAAAKGKRRKRGRFAVSGDVFILNFIEKKGGATTKEVNTAWKKEGRGGSADTPMSKLVKEGRLKRLTAEGIRGSIYKLP